MPGLFGAILPASAVCVFFSVNELVRLDALLTQIVRGWQEKYRHSLEIFDKIKKPQKLLIIAGDAKKVRQNSGKMGGGADYLSIARLYDKPST